MDELVAKECKRRGITRVCHFTQSRKLAHILTDRRGVRSVADLAEISADILDQNDPQRYDGQLSCINCSIEYPNSWLLSQVRARENVFKDWVVLLIDPQVLWRDGTIFTPRNAAACIAQHRKGLAGLRALYAPSIVGAYNRKYERTASMLPCCPTDGQAEALVRGSIARDLIRGVAVSSEGQAKAEAARLGFLADVPAIRWVVAPGLFNGTWSPVIRAGRRPVEGVYVPVDSVRSSGRHE